MAKLKSLGVIVGTGILAVSMAGCYDAYCPTPTYRVYVQPAPRFYVAPRPMPRHFSPAYPHYGPVHRAPPRFGPHYPHHRR